MNKEPSKTGGSAFPVQPYNQSSTKWSDGSEGMTLRDYFAAKAMSGLVAAAFSAAAQARTDPDEAADSLVRACYKIADKMIKERSKP